MDSAAAECMECRISRSRVRTTAKMAALWTLAAFGHYLTLFGLVLGPPLKWVGWIVPAFLYGIAAVVCLRSYFQKGPQVVLNREGIEDTRQALGVIPWKEIRRFSIHSLHDVEFLSVEVADPDKYLSQLTWWNRFGSTSLVKKGFPAIAISFVHLDPSLDEVWQFLCERHPDLT
ncbi:MAG: hypothetical protein HY290_11925 [Planctomycetia bacterium]|nr:hypothetical protein [Planctomycetia bacterium]